MSDLNASARAAVLKTVMDRIKRAYDEARAEADEELRRLHEVAGASRFDVTVPGIGKVAKITLTVPEAAVALDESALLWWVKRRHPDKIRERVVTTEFVDADFVTEVCSDLVFDPDADVLMLKTTAEVVTWARLVPAGRGTTTLTFETGGRERIQQAWQSGGLLPQLMLESAPVEDVPTAEELAMYEEEGP